MAPPSSRPHRLTHASAGPAAARAGRAGRSRGSAAAPSRSQTADWLGTAGWTAKGVLYLLIGILALQLALSGGADADQASKEGAMQSLVDKPFGGFVLGAVVLGLFAYAAYRLLAAVLLSDTRGDHEAKENGQRVVHVCSAIAYAAFGVQGVSILLGRSSGGGDPSQKRWSAVLLSSTPGTIVLLAVGIGFLVFAGWQIRQSIKRSFLDKLDCPAGSFFNRRTVGWIGVTGLSARALVAALVGVFVVVSVWHHDPNEARGLDGVLRSVVSVPAGPPLLAVVAVGLAAYGVFCFVSARCRRHEQG